MYFQSLFPKTAPKLKKPLPKKSERLKLVHSLFIVRVAGSEDTGLHSLFIVRVAGSEDTFMSNIIVKNIISVKRIVIYFIFSVLHSILSYSLIFAQFMQFSQF
jgi:hypothetical protein